jgi:flagellar motility protein MotE (MotC chaperone)
MVETLDRGIRERRTIEEAHADLVASYKKRPSRALARMIEQLEAEIAERTSQQGGR